ncbi:MAG: DUF1028 domain-containing protein [Pseudomonadota bacterium]
MSSYQSMARAWIVRLSALSIFVPATALATFSIAACDAETGACGVAVATHNLAVGNSVPFAVSELGAGVSQFETNPQHATVIVESLRAGSAAKDAISEALDRDSEFPDGLGAAYRQLGVVRFSGDATAYTGSEAGGYAGHQTTRFASVQGNGLASEDVLTSMLDRFEHSEGPLAERLLGALEAGYAAGGQTIGVTSAALLVATPQGWPVDIDLRVDFAPGTAIVDLRQMLDATTARTLLFRARRSNNPEEAKDFALQSTRLAPTWDRIWLGAAQLAARLGDDETARANFRRFAELNPVWAERLAPEFEASLQPE